MIQGTITREQSGPHGYGVSFDSMSDDDRKELALLIADSDEPSVK